MRAALETGRTEAGCDEAGRGCLAGPVFAAAVILPPGFDLPLLNDSKKLTARVREALRIEIEKSALAWAVASLDNQQIDTLNILRASIMAMHQAVSQLSLRPQHLLIDGNRFLPYQGIPHTCIVKGDAKFAPIAAASVLAKTYRDQFMQQIDQEYPCYHWAINKGYPTAEHRLAISQYGITPYHRRSYKLVDNQQKIDFFPSQP